MYVRTQYIRCLSGAWLRLFYDDGLCHIQRFPFYSLILWWDRTQFTSIYSWHWRWYVALRLCTKRANVFTALFSCRNIQMKYIFLFGVFCFFLCHSHQDGKNDSEFIWMCVRSEGDYAFQMMISGFSIHSRRNGIISFSSDSISPEKFPMAFIGRTSHFLCEIHMFRLYIPVVFVHACLLPLLFAVFSPRAYDVFIYKRTHKIRHWTIVWHSTNLKFQLNSDPNRMTSCFFFLFIASHFLFFSFLRRIQIKMSAFYLGSFIVGSIT